MNKSFRCFVAGGLLGIAAGFILQPQLDQGTKKKIIDKGKDIIEDASQMIKNKDQYGV